MAVKEPARYQNVTVCVDDVFKKVGKDVVLGLPLGLGKPNHFVNEVYKRVKENPELKLTICTALSLQRPTWSSDLERRFLEPFVERVFGGYVDLEYVADLRKDQLPANVRIKEFYTKAGSYLNLRHAQENYVSSNYTHVHRDLVDTGVNVLAQMVCEGKADGRTVLSLSSNPDVTLDVVKALRVQEQAGRRIAVIGQVNQNLPFMYGDAVVEPGMFTGIIDNPDYYYRLFGAPKMAVTTTDFMIGLAASSMISHGGTRQIGIGSLGDALVYGLQLRHENNDVYRAVLKDAAISEQFGDVIEAVGGVEPFEVGLNGSTEMLVDGYLHLMRCGVVKRKTYNHLPLQRLLCQGKFTEEVSGKTVKALLEHEVIGPKLTEEQFGFMKEYGILKEECKWADGEIVWGAERVPADLSDGKNLGRVIEHCLGSRLKKGILIHGGFFLGPESFYEALRNMNEEERRLIAMTSVLKVNQLYENEYASEELRILQRPHGRFVNACLMVTLSGAVVSDGLASGQMVSGVGGQYNFVSQAHALPDGRSILMCKATRAKGKEVNSNIVYNYGHITIPRHLRDLIITEYGVADLRGKSDGQIIAALLNIADSRFQGGLILEAKAAKKIPDDYVIPDRFRNNLPRRLEESLGPYREKGFFKPFPFGTDFTQEELVLGKALKALKARMAQGLKKISSLGKAMTIRKVPPEAMPYLERMQLDKPANAKERMLQKLIIHSLALTGVVKR